MAEEKEVKKVETTKEQYDEFCEEFFKSAKELGLVGWSLHVAWEKLDNRFAEIRYDVLSRSACAVFAKENEHGDLVDPKRSARHEAGHLLLADIVHCAYNQKNTDMIDKEDERIANTIAHILGELHDKKRD